MSKQEQQLGVSILCVHQKKALSDNTTKEGY
jgi:hypothetical protein